MKIKYSVEYLKHPNDFCKSDMEVIELTASNFNAKSVNYKYNYDGMYFSVELVFGNYQDFQNYILAEGTTVAGRRSLSPIGIKKE